MVNYHGLFFEDLLDDGKTEPNGEDKISFIYPWIFNMNDTHYSDDEDVTKFFQTSHQFGSIQCHAWINFQSRRLSVVAYSGMMEESSCSASYEIYSDNEMRFKTYDSSNVDLSISDDSYQTRSAPFLQRLCDTAQKYHDAVDAIDYRVVVYIKLQIPSKFFLQPYKYQRVYFKHQPGKLPITEEEHEFVYDFIAKSDFKIKCLDGEIPAIKKQLFVASLFFQNLVKKDLSIAEKSVHHKIDVVQPIITYLHSLCFEMPAVFDFNFAKRLLVVIEKLQPIHESDIKKVVFLSICEKVSREPPTFSSSLQWLSLAICPFEGRKLYDMICTYIATEFHMKWLQKFPRHLQTFENPEYAELVLPGDAHDENIFTDVDELFRDILITDVILP